MYASILLIINRLIYRTPLFITLVLVAVAMTAQAQQLKDIPKFELAVALIKKYEGWHGHTKHHPYVGYGHKLLPGERYTHRMNKRRADALLRSDLRKLCATFRSVGKEFPLACNPCVQRGPWQASRLWQAQAKSFNLQVEVRRPQHLQGLHILPLLERSQDTINRAQAQDGVPPALRAIALTKFRGFRFPRIFCLCRRIIFAHTINFKKWQKCRIWEIESMGNRKKIIIFDNFLSFSARY